MSIYVVDQIMGSGKTTAMIRFIKEASLEQPFLYITPYLDEVSRIMDSCSGKEFCEEIRHTPLPSRLQIDLICRRLLGLDAFRSEGFASLDKCAEMVYNYFR